MAFTVIATVTDQARNRIADSLLTGKSFRLNAFSVSDGGHSPGDPTVALAPDPTAVLCPTSTTSYGPVAINASTLVSAFCPQLTCVLNLGDANGPVSSLCVFAEFIYSETPNDPDIGQSFLFAVANFPLKVKTSFDVWSFNVLVQL